MATPLEERVSRLEAGYEHLATKADVADVRASVESLRADFHTALAAAQADTNRRIDRVFWAMLGIGSGLLAAAVAALLRFYLG